MQSSVAMRPRWRRVERLGAETALRAVLIAIPIVLVLVAFMLQAADYGFGAEPRGRWDLKNERTVPAAWSTLLFLMAAALMLALARADRRTGRREWRWWLGLAAVAVALGFDEFFSFHERTIEPVRDFFGTSGPLLYAWVIPGLIIFAALCLVFARFVGRMEPPLRRALVGSAALLLAGGIVMEMVGGWWADELGINFGWMVVYTVEESLELAGATVIVLGLLAAQKTRPRPGRPLGGSAHSARSRPNHPSP